MSSDRAFRISNRIVTGILLAGWIVLLLRPSEPANRVVLGRYSPFAFTLIAGWGGFTLLHFLLTRYTTVGRRIFGANLWLAVGSTLLALSAAELAARAVFPPRSNALVNHLWRDTVLGINRLDAHTPGHDRHGFRNRDVPDQVDVLFIGDSQTYGNGVTREETFAARFAAMTGRSTYNLALGGWGPVEYDWALREFGPSLAPELVVVSLYLGNDLYDVLELENSVHAFGLPPVPPSRAVDLRRQHAEFSAQLKRATPAARKIEGTLNRLRLWDVATRTTGITLETYDFYTEWGRRYAAAGASDPDRHWLFRETPYFAYEGGRVRTIFTPTLRYFPVAPQVEPAVAYVGTLLLRMGDAARDLGAELVIVVIPTKEEVYAPHLAARGVNLPVAFVQLLDRTQAVRAELEEMTRDRGVPWIDLVPTMQQATARGQRLYLKSRSGHPNAEGHRIIATVLAQELGP